LAHKQAPKASKFVARLYPVLFGRGRACVLQPGCNLGYPTELILHAEGSQYLTQAAQLDGYPASDIGYGKLFRELPDSFALNTIKRG
jgi:hypothetical protein